MFRTNKLKVYGFPFLILIILIIISWKLLDEINYFKITHIMINDKQVSEQQLKSILGVDLNKDIYSIDLMKVKERVQSLYSTQTVRILKKYPSSLLIEVFENEIVAFLKSVPVSKNKLLGISLTGQIINTIYYENINDRNNLFNQPMIISYLPVIPINNIIGTEISDKFILSVIQSLSLIKKLDLHFYKKINSIVLYKKHEQNYLILNDLKTKFFFGEELSFIKLLKIDSLEEDLSTKISFRKIDLRFDDIIGRN